MTRADTYDELAQLEQLFDEYSQIQSLDPSKLPALRERIWATAHRRRHRPRPRPGRRRPTSDGFDDVIVHVDGYLCGLKDAQIRGGLHTLGAAPEGEALVDLVLAITRLRPRPGRRRCGPSVAAELGLDLDDPRALDAIEAAVPRAGRGGRGRAGWTRRRRRPARRVRWVCDWLVPNLRRADRRDRQPAGRPRRPATCPPGRAARSPAAAPTCCRPAGTSTPSTPRRCPPSCSWEVGCKLADAVARAPPRRGGHATRAPSGWCCGAPRSCAPRATTWPRRWRCSASGRCGRPESRRVVGLEADPARRARPAAHRRHAAHLRASSATPSRTWSHLLDDAVALAASLDEAAGGQLRARPTAPTTRASTDPPRAPTASGILQRLEQRYWRSDDDLAAIYIAWSGLLLRPRAATASPTEDAMRRRFAAIDVAVKNQDNREHDIFDSDDYLQDHGGMIATIRSLTGRDPKAWFGDSADPARPAGALAGRGGRPGGAHPGGQPPLDRGDAAPRLQGRVRDGGHGRLPVRLRRHRQRRRRLDVRAGHRGLRRRSRRCGSSSSSRTRGRCSRSPSGCSRRSSGACGRPARRPSAPCGRRCSRPRAGRSRGDRRCRFSAVVGQDDAKLALLLAAAEPRLGGVLLRGDKGSAKTTLARGLAGAAARATRRSSSCRSAPPRTGSSARSTSPSCSPTASPGSGPACWPRPTAACSTSTRSTCSPTTSSTPCSTWRCRA